MSKIPVVKPAIKWVASHKMWSLDSSLTPRQISAILQNKVPKTPGCHKVKHRWEFLVNGKECAIWDYHDVRWSAYGPREAFEKLGLKVL